MLITVPPVKYDSICTNLQIYNLHVRVCTITHFQKYIKRVIRSKNLTSITRLEMEIFNTYVLSIQNRISQDSVTVIDPVKYTPSVNRSNNIDF